MSHSILKFCVVAGLMLLAVLLFMDSTTFGLQKADPLSGRGRGCYTMVEILLEVKRPTDWIRVTELAAAGVLGVSGIVTMITWRRSE